MGRAADKRLKRRREAARMQRRANRNERAALGDVADVAAGRLADLDAAPVADVKAVQAKTAEWLETVALHPDNAAAAAMFMRTYSRMTDGERRTDGDDVFPRLSARHREFAALLTAGPGHRMCAHLDARPEPVAVACQMCPAAGLFCLECLRDHGTAHDPADEYRCDQCGQPDMRGLHSVRPDPVTAVPVQRIGDDHVRLYPGAVLLSGFGICKRCKTAAGRKRARSVVPQQKSESPR
jgi:hypothetical protein